MFKHSTPRKLWLAAALLILLAGCADKPPGCADALTAQRLGDLFPKDVVANISANIESAGNWNKSPEKTKMLRAWLADYQKGIKIELRNIVSEGYSSNARRHRCTADVMLTTAVENERGARSAYTVQAIEGEKGDFRIEMAMYVALVNAASNDFDMYYERRIRGLPVKP